VSERRNALRAFFDRAAPDWASRPLERDRAEDLIARIDLQPGERILDLGCGTGSLLPLLRAAVGPRGRIWAIDLSLEMLRRVPAAASASRCCAAVEHLPLRDQQADAAVCAGLLPHLQDPVDALSEIGRTLRPGGRIALLHLIGRRQLNALHARIGGPLAADRLPTGAEVASHLGRAGFQPGEILDAPDRFLATGRRP
jgi:ubiquinone/menaquinone biosynthesis C-methylase UbiE